MRDQAERTCANPVCGGEPELIYQLGEFDVWHCRVCGLRYRQPFPSAEEIERMYTDSSYLSSAYFAGQTDTTVDPKRPELAIYREGLDWLDRHSGVDKADGGTLLDVGAGTGFFLQLARERGWAVSGVEISATHVEEGQRRFGVEVLHGDFSTMDLPRAAFDVITMWDLLEHVEAPGETLAKARGLLKPDGHLVIFTIDSDSLFNRLAGVGYHMTRGVMKRAIELLYDKRHNFYFTSRSLETLLEQERFEIRHRKSHRAHLGRWLSEPAPGLMIAAAELVDLASVPLGMHYRQLLYCRPAK
jgi:2-polyprenyl-3-methyl-5-hydroxy-6-metoxy-1,4-benzoquinol methylase